MINAIRHHRDTSPAVILELTEKQLTTLSHACAELEIVLNEQYAHLHPAQKRFIKICVRDLEKLNVWAALEAGLEAVEAGK